MQRLEVNGAVRHIYASLGFKGLKLVEEIILYYDARSKKHQIT